ncbi:hypothetical protein NVP1244A_038 [Vibrio phage 1.244.A._10N.261.54.C3]|nr:hypothetical protein NVP1244A_038 [Vibrio phage 1.244.A._10N.261.54.C3]AUR98666.1 hypothetical protein NVP1255O_038 [Vibrio phage 1.255.O._10N.286.45.F1]
MATLKHILSENAQQIDEAFNSKPYETAMTKKGAGDVFFTFEDEDGKEFRIQFYTSGGLGKAVRRVYVGEKQGNVYKDAVKGFKNPMRVIATMIKATEDYLKTPLGKTIQGLAIDLSKKAAPKGVRLIKQIVKRSKVIKKHLDIIDSDLTVDAGRGVVWTVRKGVDPSAVYDGKKVAGMLGGGEDVAPKPESKPKGGNTNPNQPKEFGNWTVYSSGEATHADGKIKNLVSIIYDKSKQRYAATISNQHVYGMTDIQNKLSSLSLTIPDEVLKAMGDEVETVDKTGGLSGVMAGKMFESLEPLLRQSLAFYGGWTFEDEGNMILKGRFHGNGYEFRVGVSPDKLKYIFEGNLYNTITPIVDHVKTMVEPVGGEPKVNRGHDSSEAQSAVDGVMGGLIGKVRDYIDVNFNTKSAWSRDSSGNMFKSGEIDGYSFDITIEQEGDFMWTVALGGSKFGRSKLGSTQNFEALNIWKWFKQIKPEWADDVETMNDDVKISLGLSSLNATHSNGETIQVDISTPELVAASSDAIKAMKAWEFEDSGDSDISDLGGDNRIDIDFVKSMAADEGWKLQSQSSDGSYAMFSKGGYTLGVSLDGEWDLTDSDNNDAGDGDWGDAESLRRAFQLSSGGATAVDLSEAQEQLDGDTNTQKFPVAYTPKFKVTSRNILSGFKPRLKNEGAKFTMNESLILVHTPVVHDENGLFFPSATWRGPKFESGVSAPRILEAILEDLAGGGLTTNAKSLNRSGTITAQTGTIEYKSRLIMQADTRGTWELELQLAKKATVGNFGDMLRKPSGAGPDYDSDLLDVPVGFKDGYEKYGTLKGFRNGVAVVKVREVDGGGIREFRPSDLWFEEARVDVDTGMPVTLANAKKWMASKEITQEEKYRFDGKFKRNEAWFTTGGGVFDLISTVGYNVQQLARQMEENIPGFKPYADNNGMGYARYKGSRWQIAKGAPKSGGVGFHFTTPDAPKSGGFILGAGKIHLDEIDWNKVKGWLDRDSVEAKVFQSDFDAQASSLESMVRYVMEFDKSYYKTAAQKAALEDRIVGTADRARDMVAKIRDAGWKVKELGWTTDTPAIAAVGGEWRWSIEKNGQKAFVSMVFSFNLAGGGGMSFDLLTPSGERALRSIYSTSEIEYWLKKKMKK